MRRLVLLGALAIALALMVAPVVMAQQKSTGSGGLGGFMDFSLISTSLESTSAHEQGMGSRGIGLELGGGITASPYFLAGVQLQGQWMKDKDQFSNETTGGTMSSSVWFLDASVLAGLRAPALKVGPHSRLQFGVNVGKSFAKGNRSISGCINCDSEDLQVRGGTYYEPTIGIGNLNEKGKGSVFAVSLRKYLSGSDMQYAVLAGLRRYF